VTLRQGSNVVKPADKSEYFASISNLILDFRLSVIYYLICIFMLS